MFDLNQLKADFRAQKNYKKTDWNWLLIELN